MTTRLTLYNGALTRHIGQTKLDTLSDDQPVRHALDVIWDSGAVDTCLQAGQWNFAVRDVALEFDPNISPQFQDGGYQHAFERPSDLVRIMAICQDPHIQIPFTDYQYSGAYWYADIETIYIRYVSNDASFGGDFSLWPANFTRYVECYLAKEAGPRAGLGEKKVEALEIKCLRLLREAKVTDAMENPTMLPPMSGWAQARGGRVNRERGKRNRLIG